MKDLRESGQIEQDADVILLLKNDRAMDYKVIVAKNKEGRLAAGAECFIKPVISAFAWGLPPCGRKSGAFWLTKPQGIKINRVRLKRLSGEYARFSKATGQPIQQERAQVAGFGQKRLEPGLKTGTMRKSGKPGDTDGFTTLDKVEAIDFADSIARKDKIEEFCAEFKKSPVEHTLVISPDGHAYQLTGMSGAVNPLVAGEDAVRGSIGVHNHPIRAGEKMGDSFSRDDIVFSARHGTIMEYLVSGPRRNAFRYTGALSPEELDAAYRVAEQSVLERAFAGEIDLDTAWRQEEIMRELVKQLEGFEFYENF